MNKILLKMINITKISLCFILVNLIKRYCWNIMMGCDVKNELIILPKLPWSSSLYSRKVCDWHDNRPEEAENQPFFQHSPVAGLPLTKKHKTIHKPDKSSWSSPTGPPWPSKPRHALHWRSPISPPLTVSDTSILNRHRQVILTVKKNVIQKWQTPFGHISTSTSTHISRRSDSYFTYLLIIYNSSRHFLFIVFAILANLIKPQKPYEKKGKECQLIYATVWRLRCYDNVRLLYPHPEVPCRNWFSVAVITYLYRNYNQSFLEAGIIAT